MIFRSLSSKCLNILKENKVFKFSKNKIKI